MCKCFFSLVICAEWLHSVIHGSPGESPGGGTVSPGERGQPEHCHRGSVHLGFILLVIFLLPWSSTSFRYNRVSLALLFFFSIFNRHILRLHPLPSPSSLGSPSLPRGGAELLWLCAAVGGIDLEWVINGPDSLCCLTSMDDTVLIYMLPCTYTKTLKATHVCTWQRAQTEITVWWG